MCFFLLNLVKYRDNNRSEYSELDPNAPNGIALYSDHLSASWRSIRIIRIAMRFIYTKSFAIFFASLVLIVILVSMEIKGWLNPVRELFINAPRPFVYIVRGVTKPVKNFAFTVYRLGSIVKENNELTQRTSKLEQELVNQNQYKLENEILKKELGFVSANKYSLTPCTVIAQNPSGLTQTAIINCGLDKGIEEGRAVISQGYLVGKVLEAYKSTSIILLVNSSKFSSDARLSQTNDSGIIQGSFSSGIILDRLSQNSRLEKGWMVITGGIDVKVPKNIMVGEVGEVLSGPNESFKRATVLSPIDFNNLEFVFVVK